jgi:hypothetical protein
MKQSREPVFDRARAMPWHTGFMTRRQLLLTTGSLPLVALAAPRPAPEFTVTLQNGRNVKLSDYRGKVLGFACILTT